MPINTHAEFLEAVKPPAAGDLTAAPYIPPKPVPLEAVASELQGSVRADAVAVFDQSQNLQDTTMLESAKAAVQNWDTIGLLERAVRPTYPPMQGFDSQAAMQALQTPLEADAREFLLKADSPDEFSWRVKRLEESQERAQVAGMSPLLSFAVSAFDPAYLLADFVFLGAGRAAKVGRLGSGALAAGGAAGISAAAGETRPVSDKEVIFNALLNGAATAALYRSGKVVNQEYPQEARASAEAGLNETPEQTIANADKANRSRAEWSLYKTVSQTSAKGAEIARRLLSDPVNQGIDSAADIQRELSARVGADLVNYQNFVQSAIQPGFKGYMRRLYDPKGYAKAQADLENAVAYELNMRNAMPGHRSTDPTIAKAADLHNAYMERMGRELEEAGMVEPGFVDANPNYFPRVMVERRIRDAEKLVTAKGLRNSLSQSLRRANPGMDSDSARVIAYAVLERARRKGRGIDNSGIRTDDLGRDELIELVKTGGFDPRTIDKALALIGRKSEDAGAAPNLKTRMKLDMFQQIGKTDLTIADLFDTNLSTLADSYHQRMTGRVAAHRVGLTTDKDWEKLRVELANSIDDAGARKEALDMFDDIHKTFLGAPVGESLPNALRMLGALNTATGLAASGFWQVVEYGTIMQRYGAIATVKQMLKSMPEARKLWKDMKHAARTGDKQTGWDIEEVLTAEIANDVRIRPLIQHYEDMFSAQKGPWMQRAELARDGAMFVNMQKYIHFHQARTMAALSMQVLRKAADGDAKAVAAMTRYGATPELLARVKAERTKHGMDVSTWADDVYREVHSSLIRSMDDAVVRARLGEIPAFAEFSQLGKFLFKFRTFVLAAHNKTALSTLKEGPLAMATLLAYQLPLAMAATMANNAISGKPAESIEDTAGKAFGYLSAIGLASELVGVLSGNSRSFGAPGLLWADRLYAGAAAARNGDLGGTAAATIQAIPLVSLIPGIRALTNAIKED